MNVSRKNKWKRTRTQEAWWVANWSSYNLTPEISFQCVCIFAQLFDFLIQQNSLITSNHRLGLTFVLYEYMRHVRSKVYRRTRNKSLYSGSSPSTFLWLYLTLFLSFKFCPSYCKHPRYSEYIICLPYKPAKCLIQDKDCNLDTCYWELFCKLDFLTFKKSGRGGGVSNTKSKASSYASGIWKKFSVVIVFVCVCVSVKLEKVPCLRPNRDIRGWMKSVFEYVQSCTRTVLNSFKGSFKQCYVPNITPNSGENTNKKEMRFIELESRLVDLESLQAVISLSFSKVSLGSPTNSISLLASRLVPLSLIL